MNKQTFLKTLRMKLSYLSSDEINERLAFYEEMIDDRIEEGMTEEEATAAVGSVDKIAEQIMTETPLTKIVAKKVKPQKQLAVWAIVLLVLGAPVWIPLVLSLAATLFSIYIAIWCVLIGLFAFNFGLAVGAVVAIPCAIHFFVVGNAGAGLFMIGAGFILAALAILMFLLNLLISKGIVFLSDKFVLWIKSLFVGKKTEKKEDIDHENP